MMRAKFRRRRRKRSEEHYCGDEHTIEEHSLISYDAAGGGHVDISFPLNPYKVLGLPSTTSQIDIKQAFKNEINQPSRQNRALISIANHILTSMAMVNRYHPDKHNLSYSIRELDHFILAAAGHTRAIAAKINSGEDILDDVDEHGRTLLYLACKSGFYDTSKLLLEKGASVNRIQGDGSTALHAAAYYGHKLVVGLLLEHGAATDIKNVFGDTALEEGNDEVKSLIQAASTDCITSLAAELRKERLVTGVRFIKYSGKTIGKELVRDPRSLDEFTRSQWDDIIRTWEPVWHGTRYKHLPFILENGLLPAGSGGIKPPENHYPLGEEHFGIKNWAAAIFVSPSIMYAGHACYAERVLSESRQWCVLVKAFCKPKSYKSYDPTVYRYDPVDGDPATLEYRVPVTIEDKHVVYRVESSRNVVVRSLIFVSLSFLEDENIDFKQALELFA